MADADGRDWEFSLWDWEGLPITTDAVLTEWVKMAQSRWPWSAMPLDDMAGYLRIIITELIHDAWDDREQERGSRVHAAAQKHGCFRRRQSVAHYSLSYEFQMLLGALASALSTAGFRPGFTADCVTVFEHAVAPVALEARAAWFASRPRDVGEMNT